MTHSNRLLAAIGDLDSLTPHLRTVHLQHKTVLLDIGDNVSTVVFPYTAIVSMVAQLSDGETMEVAMIGRDGGVGVGAALDSRVSRTRSEVQHPGEAVVCDVHHFRHSILGNQRLTSLMFHHEQVQTAEIQQSAICIASHQVEARLARWLLRARDLTDSDTFNFTQEYLAEMLAVKRTSISPAAGQFMDKGLIKYSRGQISILNRSGLEAVACECYHTVKNDHDI
jgi:CRP-like cAMP-binding protein